MWKRKKSIVVALVLAVVLVSSITGVVLAQTDNGDGNQLGALSGALWDKVTSIYEQKTGDTLDLEALKEAFADAQSDMQIEVMQDRLQEMVEEGKITQEQADEYLDWQKARPDVPVGSGFGRHGGFSGMCGPFVPAE